MSSTTFVTAFYDLGKIENNPKRRSFDAYKSYSRDLLRRPIDLVVIGDEDCISYVQEERKTYGLLERTAFLCIPFETLPAYKYKETLDEMIPRTGVNGYKESHRLTASYLICIWSKIYVLLEASRKNPFNATYFCWIDFGYYHLATEYDYMQNYSDEIFTSIEDHPEFRAVALNAFDPSYVKNASEFYKKDNYSITGQIFSGNADTIGKVYDVFMKEVEECIRVELPTPEENIFGRLVYLYPDLFNLRGGYYSTSLSNFSECRQFPDKCCTVGNEFAKHGMNRHAYNVLENVMKGYEKNKSLLSDRQVYDILFQMVICSYYVKREYYDKWVAYTKHFLETSEIQPSGLFLANLRY